MRIEKYNASRLKEFLNSDLYREMPFVPVSPHRASSWLNNPRMKPEDILLYLGFEGETMMAYRSILPDRHGDIRFGWLSGNWVRPDQRRMGLASRLFEEAYADWGHQLMYTNYAPESKAVYDKSGRFQLYVERPGIRYYQRSSSASLLGGRRIIYRRSRSLLSLADGMLNAVQDIRIAIKKENTRDLVFEESVSPDFEAVDFIQNNRASGFCLRSQDDFDWIASYPWIKSGPSKDPRYFFSSVSNRFHNICVKIRDERDEMSGFLWLVINAEKMTIPYAVVTPEKAMKVSAVEEAGSAFSRILNHFLQSNKISYLTTHHPSVIDVFQPGPILTTRKMTQNYFVSRDLKKQLPDPKFINFQDGDGDVVFV